MALVSLGQAAKLAGLGKTTLARAIKAGASLRDPARRRGVSDRCCRAGAGLPAARPYGRDRCDRPARGTVVHLATGDATGGNLAGEIEALRATAALMREQIADLREDRDRWRDRRATRHRAPGTPRTPPATLTAEDVAVALAALDGVTSEPGPK